MDRGTSVAVGYASAGHFLCHGSKVILPVSLAVVAAEFGVTLVAMAWALTAYGVAMGLAALPAGLLADRRGAPAVLNLYFWFLAGGALLCAAADGFATFVVAHGLLGAAAGLYHPPGLALVSLASSREGMGRALGLHGVFGNFGIAGAPLLVLAATPLFGWRGAFLALAGSAVLCALAGGVLRRRGLLAAAPPGAQPGAERGRLSRTGLFWLLVAMSVNGFLLDGFTTAFPETARSRLDLVWDAQWLNAAVFGLGAVGQWVGGLLANGERQGGRYVGLLALQPLVFVGAALALDAPFVAVLQLGAFMFVNWMTQPLENRLLAGFTSSARRSSAYALKFVVALVVGAAAPPVVVGLMESRGHGAAWFALAAVGVLGVAAGRAFASHAAPPAPAR